MKTRYKQDGRSAPIPTKHVQPIGLIGKGSSMVAGPIQELVGIYIVVVLLFVAFSFWFSFGMLS